VTRKIILGSCLLLVLCILWIAWPKTNVWNEIMNGETEAVRARIEAGFEVNSICPGVDTLTLGEKWKYLSEFEWPPKEYKQRTAMSIAVEEKHPGMVQLLVDNGADWPSARSIIGLGEKNLAKRCIQQGGRLDLDDLKYTDRAGLVGWLIEQELELGIDKNILLHWAALNGDAKAVESLIKRGADSKNAHEANGNTPLHAVVLGVDTYERKDRKLENRAAIIQQLIASGADVNAKNKYGETPVDLAFGVEKLYQPLRKHGGKPGNYLTILSKTSFRPDNPMMYGSPTEPDFKEQLDQYEKFENEMAILIREIAADGHDINGPITNFNGGRNYYGEPDYWKSTGDVDGDGVSDDAEDQVGTDPFDPDDTPTPEKLAEYELNLTNPLFTVLRKRHSAKIISLLIELGANVNVSEKQTGDTPLHLANEYPKIRVAEVSIANGANVNALNKEGETPLDIRHDIRIEHQRMSGYMPSEYITTDTSEETEEDPLVTLLLKHGAKTGDELIEEGQ